MSYFCMILANIDGLLPPQTSHWCLDELHAHLHIIDCRMNQQKNSLQIVPHVNIQTKFSTANRYDRSNDIKHKRRVAILSYEYLRVPTINSYQVCVFLSCQVAPL